MTDPLQSFINAMEKDGIAPAVKSQIIADDKWHRFQLVGDPKAKKVGYCRLKIDGDFAVGNYGTYREGVTHTWTSNLRGKEYTDEEKKVFRERVEKEKREQEHKRQQEQEIARKRAKKNWDGAPFAKPDHPYLQKKVVGPHCLRQRGDNLLVPMYADKKLQSVQTISADGDKLFEKNARKAGCYCPLANKDESFETFLLAEGFATGASLREIMGIPVIVCFDAGNILPVAETFRKNYPRSKIIICADNDAWQRETPKAKERSYVGPDSELNTGIVKARQAAASIGHSRVTYPEFKKTERYTDFNDLHVAYGGGAVKKRIEEALNAPMPATQENIQPDIPERKKEVGPVEQSVGWMERLINKYDAKGNLVGPDPTKSINYSILLQYHPELRGIFIYDEFQMQVVVVKCPPWEDIDEFKVHKLDDPDIYECDYQLQRHGMSGNTAHTRAAIYTAAMKNKRHPVREYFDSLEWDGEPRLDSWLIEYCNAVKDDPDYVRAVGRTWMIAAVKRIYQPGAKFDHMLILEGKQAAGKSTTLRYLATFGDKGSQEEYFTDAFQLRNCENKDELTKLNGVLIVEIPEMSGFTKKDHETLKAFVTTQHDEYRKAYGIENKNYPRQFVLAGSYNPINGLFSDPTGYRRFWCVGVENIDMQAVYDNREQLWAEAVHRYKQGESIVLSDALYKKAEEEGAKRRIEDDWSSEILTFTRNRKYTEVREIMEYLGIDRSRRTRQENLRICSILKMHSYERVQKRVGGQRVTVWETPPPDVGGPTQRELETQEEHEEDVPF